MLSLHVALFDFWTRPWVEAFNEIWWAAASAHADALIQQSRSK